MLNNQSRNPENIAREIASLYVVEPLRESDSKSQKTSTPIQVPLEILDDHMGIYKLGAALYLTISRYGNQLWTQANPKDIFPMTTKSDTAFKIVAYGDQAMTFYRDTLGNKMVMKYIGEMHPEWRKTLPLT